MRRLVRLFALLVVAAAFLPATAAADSYPVTNTDDSGEGSLRQAILDANAHTGADVIPIGATGTIELQTQLPTINDDVTINGPGAEALAIERAAGAPSFRILEFIAVDAAVTDLTVRDGRYFAGAGILSVPGSLTLTRVVVTGNEAPAEGSGTNFAGAGGILSGGVLTLRESLVYGNVVTARSGERNVASGGGIEATGAVVVERSTISGNLVQALAEGEPDAVAEGGGLLLVGGPVTIEESTISGNSVLATEGTEETVARGGGIQGEGMSLTSSTVTGNSAETDGTGSITDFAGGANLLSAATLVRNTIVSDPGGDADSCEGSIASGGFNIDEGNSCPFGRPTDLVNTVPGLDPVLRFNGGFTPTHALLEGSVAIDRGNSFGSSVDQRGLPRPVDFATKSNTEGGDGADIGAFEVQAPPSPPPASPVTVQALPTDKSAPDTRVTKGPPRVTFKRLAKFWFTSTEAQSTFQCKVDNQPWRGCRSPAKRKVSGGAKHVFKVRAIDRFGNVDPTPARFGWRVKSIGG